MQTVRDAALGPAPEGPDTPRWVFQAIWRQACEGLDVERLLPSREKRARDLAKKLDRPLDRNGWRIFVSGQAYAMKHGKARQQRNAEVMLVETVARWPESGTGSTAGERERPAADREGWLGESGEAPGPRAAGARMSIRTRARSDEIPGYWSMPDPEKVQHRASYGLVFPLIGPKISDCPQESRPAASDEEKLSDWIVLGSSQGRTS